MHRPARSNTRSIVLLCAAVLAACGGGGNESGPEDSIQLQPSSLTATGSATACVSGTSAKVFVYGGDPPYKLANSIPNGIALDTARVSNSGEAFTVTFLGGCFSNLPVTVEDSAGRLATLTVNSILGQ